MVLDRVKDRLNDGMKRVYHSPQPLIFKQKYYYVLGFTKEKNRKVFWGPLSEDEAYTYMGELNEGEVFPLETRDPRRAVKEVRSILIKRGDKPDDALRRLLHKHDSSTSSKSSASPTLVSRLFAGRFRVGPTAGITKATAPPESIQRRVVSRNEP